MSRLLVAVLGSNQDQNPVRGGGNEMVHIWPLASALAVEAANRPGIVARVFQGRPESLDRPSGSLSGLVAQQRTAAAWIESERQPEDLTVALNLHSDSGSFRHCGYYYDGSGTVSQWLGRALAESVKSWFGGKVLSADYSGHIFARELRAVACPVLLELGAHTIPADVAAVDEHAAELIGALVGTLVGFFGLESTPPLNTSELRVFGEWALARLDHGEDPRIRAEFVEHVSRLGADGTDLGRWGWPG